MSLQEQINVVMESGLSDIDKGKINRLLRLISKSSARMDGFELRAAREAAGLSLGQAANLLNTSAATLRGYEEEDWNPGQWDHGFEIIAAIDRVYGLEDESPASANPEADNG